MKNQHKYLNFTFFALLSLLLLLFYFNVSIAYADNSACPEEFKIILDQLHSIIEISNNYCKRELVSSEYSAVMRLLKAKRLRTLSIFDSVEFFNKLSEEQLQNLSCLFDEMSKCVDYINTANYIYSKSFINEVHDQLLLSKDILTLRLREIVVEYNKH